MSKLYRVLVLFVITILTVSCSTPVGEQPTPSALSENQIERYPAPDDYTSMHAYTELPDYDPDAGNVFQIDLRSAYLKKLDLSKSEDTLFHADFDSKTQWPPSDKMPVGFDWQKIMETGKDPGLGVRALHDQGITGKDVNIAIIDQTLIIDHMEYPERIRHYEEINVVPGTPSQMHGPAVASIAVGKTVGVAPDATLYYIATWMFNPLDPKKNETYEYYTQALHRIMEINQQLPENQKIRVISMSIGLDPAGTGLNEFISAIGQAREAGIFVITVDLEKIYGWNIMGLGRDSLSDPNDFQSYEPPDYWKQLFFDAGFPPDTLLIPMDSRTTASPTGKNDYVFYRQGGMSWTAPYLAGMYALAVQVKPDITPEQFWETALQTGKTIQLKHDGREYQFGVILDPLALIEALKGE
jgi:hypothetical protein